MSAALAAASVRPRRPPTGHGGGKDHRDGQHRQDALRLHGGVGHEHQKAHSRDGRADLGGQASRRSDRDGRNDQAGKRRDPAVCISKKLKVPHVSAEIARMA